MASRSTPTRRTEMPFVSFVNIERGYDAANQTMAVLSFEVDGHDPFIDLCERRPVVQLAIDPDDIEELIEELRKFK